MLAAYKQSIGSEKQPQRHFGVQIPRILDVGNRFSKELGLKRELLGYSV